MASPFDLYQQRQIEGLDPNLFNQEAYLEQQRGLYAGSLADQLNALRQQYEQQMALQNEVAPAINELTNKLNELNQKTVEFQKNAETSAKELADYQNQQKEIDSRLATINAEKNKNQKNVNDATSQAAAIKKRMDDLVAGKMNYSAFVKKYPDIEQRKRAIVDSYLKAKTAIGKDFEIKKELQKLDPQLKTLQANAATYKKAVDSTNRQLAVTNNQFKEAQQKIIGLTQQNDFAQEALQNHLKEVNTQADSLKNVQQQLGVATTTSQKALQDAETIQTQIQQFKPRERPELQKISGNYEQALKASKDELKQIAESTTDPVTRQYAQVLLNQRASELAGTFGKNLEDVNKELSADIVIPENQLTAQQYRAFMGMPELATAPAIPETIPEFSMLPTPGTQLVPVIPEQMTIAPQPTVPAPQPTIPVIPEQITFQPAAPAPQPTVPAPQPVKGPEPVIPAKTEAQPGITQQPVLQFNIAQPAEQKATQMQQPSMPMQQPGAEKQIKQESLTNQMGMPQQPFGTITPFVQQGLQQQLTKGFEQAMKIRKQPAAQAAPKQRRLGVSEERRKVVAPQVIQKPAQERAVQTSEDENSSRQKVLEQSQGKIQG